jgi:hypothetical protein
MNTQKLILLFGMPRSGTTWLGKLFDAQRQTYYLHEPDSVDANIHIPLLLDKSQAETSELPTQLPHWLSNKTEKVIASRPFFSKAYLNPVSWALFLASAYATKLAGRLGIKGLVKPVRLQPLAAPVLVWKSIESLGRMAAIRQLTGAYSIHILRHPCGHIASTLKGQDAGLFDGSIPIWQDWDLFDKLLQQSGEQRFTLDDIKAMSKEQRLAVRWGLINDFALAQSVGEPNNMVLVYEDLCKQPLQVFNTCLAFCQLSADEQCLAYLHRSTQGGGDSAYYGTTKDPLTSAYKWRKQLSAEVQQQIFAVVMQFNAGRYYQDDF